MKNLQSSSPRGFLLADHSPDTSGKQSTMVLISPHLMVESIHKPSLGLHEPDKPPLFDGARFLSNTPYK